MEAFVTALRLVALCSLMACPCFAVYGALRLFGERFPIALNCFGSLALLMWTGVFGLFCLLMGIDFRDDPSAPAPPYPWQVVVPVGVVLALTLGSGGSLLRHASQKRMIWWHGVLFYSFYLIATAAVCGSVLALTGIGTELSRAWYHLVVLAGFSIWSGGVGVATGFLMWIFPLGAPLAEICLRSFRQVWETNRTGSFA